MPLCCCHGDLPHNESYKFTLHGKDVDMKIDFFPGSLKDRKNEKLKELPEELRPENEFGLHG